MKPELNGKHDSMLADGAITHQIIPPKGNTSQRIITRRIESEGRIRLLYVEDDRALSVLIGMRLKQSGYDIDTATTGLQGWQKLLDHAYDIVLLDNNLPGISGLDIIRRASTLPDVPLMIMLTGAGNEMLAVEAMREGAIDYLVKDVAGHFIDLLPVVIRRALDYRKNRLDQLHAELATQMEVQRRELLTRFIRDASHEFRTPLAVVGTSLYLLEHSELSERQQRYTGAIRQQAGNIEKLLENMIHLVRLDALVSLERAPYAVSSLVDLINGVIRGVMHATTPHPVLVNETTSDAAILIDPDEMRLAFHHLIDNAVRYGDPANPFSLTILERDGRIEFTLVDHGIGIPEAIGAQVFDRFFRGDESRQTRGFGLGLPIARRIIELHNGTIALTSREGQGTTVIVTLPCV